MKTGDYKKEIADLLKKAPSADSIATIQAATNFKQVVANAKKANSLQKLQDSYNQLRGFYK